MVTLTRGMVLPDDEHPEGWMIVEVEAREVRAVDLVWLLVWRWRLCDDGIRVWVRGRHEEDHTMGTWVHERITIFPPPSEIEAWLRRPRSGNGDQTARGPSPTLGSGQ